MSEKLADCYMEDLEAGIRKLWSLGINFDRWLAMVSADEAEMKRFVDNWPDSSSLYTFDASRVGRALGIDGLASSTPAPKPQAGGRVIYLPECIRTLDDLRAAKANVLGPDNRYSNVPHFAKPGYWEVILPIQDHFTRHGFLDEKILPEGFEFAPLLVSTLLCSVYKLCTGRFPYYSGKDYGVLCAETIENWEPHFNTENFPIPDGFVPRFCLASAKQSLGGGCAVYTNIQFLNNEQFSVAAARWICS